MRKFLKKIHEHENAQKLNTMQPHAIFYDICNVFTKQKIRKGFINIVDFYTIIKKQPFIMKAFSTQEYSDNLPQNKVLLHGIIYDALFNIYTSFLKKSFGNDLLPEPNTNQTIIDSDKYKDLPKSLRGIFVKYDNNNYILNAPDTDIVIAFNKKNKKQLEQLLLRAKKLIPVIYKTKTEQESNVWDNGTLIPGQKFTTPAFVWATKDSLSAKLVNDEQLNTINELHDIFMQIATIAYPISTKRNEQSVAKNIYDSYQKEAQKSNIFYTAKFMVDKAQSVREEQIAKINSDYAKTHNEIMDYLKQQTHTNMK